MKRLLLCLLLSAMFLTLPSTFKRFTCGFKLAKMQLDVPFRPEWEVFPSLPPEALRAILQQPFSYLDKGAQCYVFQSQDQRYVVKLFRYRKKSREEKVAKLFAACLLAYKQVKEETGLVYLHLNETQGELPTLQAVGPIGQSLHLPLDRYRFAIQRKARPFRECLQEAKHDADPKTLLRLIDSFVCLLHTRIQKGIGNSDPTVSRNFGFLDGQAIEIDFGNYFAHPTEARFEMKRHTQRLRRWLKHHAPETVAYLDEKVNQCVEG